MYFNYYTISDLDKVALAVLYVYSLLVGTNGVDSGYLIVDSGYLIVDSGFFVWIVI